MGSPCKCKDTSKRGKMQIDSERSLQREARFGLGQAGIVNFPFMRFSRFVSQNWWTCQPEKAIKNALDSCLWRSQVRFACCF